MVGSAMSLVSTLVLYRERRSATETSLTRLPQMTARLRGEETIRFLLRRLTIVKPFSYVMQCLTRTFHHCERASYVELARRNLDEARFIVELARRNLDEARFIGANK